MNFWVIGCNQNLEGKFMIFSWFVSSTDILVPQTIPLLSFFFKVIGIFFFSLFTTQCILWVVGDVTKLNIVAHPIIGQNSCFIYWSYIAVITWQQWKCPPSPACAGRTEMSWLVPSLLYLHPAIHRELLNRDHCMSAMFCTVCTVERTETMATYSPLTSRRSFLFMNIWRMGKCWYMSIWCVIYGFIYRYMLRLIHLQHFLCLFSHVLYFVNLCCTSA